MGFLYENSNPERFQQFCQALLTTSYPKLQCFPVGQPDGGRDGYDPATRTVLQVKFKRAGDEESADWMIKVLEKELPSIQDLIAKGAQSYVMATNAKGTSHPEVGRIDKVQEWLDKNVSIPAQCLWRDEIDRRFEKASVALKMKYTELLSFEDGLEVVFREVLGDSRRAQQDAVRAFLAWQYQLDESVKFKQVSLSNSLFDLFIDVPIGIPTKLVRNTRRAHRGDLSHFLKAFGADQAWVDSPDGHLEYATRGEGGFTRVQLRTAEVLLGTQAQDYLKFVVLEGAPGQGKSTLAQFVCQVHRARFLGRMDAVAEIPEVYKQAPFRLPVKIDLRDVATYLSGKDPFDPENGSIEGPHTFERFVAALIEQGSGGVPFGAHDVLTLMQDVPVLLFLDGLDEVPDLDHRERLVAAINEALGRWAEFGCDLQVVVTSRPSVFGQAPSFARSGFVTLTLRNIDPPLITEYAEKWITSRGLDPADARPVRKILSEKLGLAHIRDLTRNPMQLTILLSLIHQIGHSLPDQRTDLYSRYVDLFLTREADKHPMVRDNRQVLLEFIQYLAWRLQADAEASNAAGSIAAPALQELARMYLLDRGHSADLADDLFGGGFERVYVLVERIEGLYEFEVQPLREFFCARHLYETTPAVTYRDGKPRGDSAQRFEALAASPFWLNVCRFYAGSCTRGEAQSLVLSLTEMIQTGEPAQAIHARRVAMLLLRDWVFSSVKFAQDQLIEAVFKGEGLYQLSGGEVRDLDELVLEEDCGQEKLRSLLFEELIAEERYEWPRALIAYVIRMNGGQELAASFLELVAASRGARRTALLLWMQRSGASTDVPGKTLWDLICSDDPEPRERLLRAANFLLHDDESLIQVPEAVSDFMDGILSVQIATTGHNFSLIGQVADALANHAFSLTYRQRYTMLRDANALRGGEIVLPESVPASVQEFLNDPALLETPVDPEQSLRDSPEIWSATTEAARRHFGDCGAVVSLAARGAGVRGGWSLAEGAERMLDGSVPMCARARYARMKRGGALWWEQQRGHIESPTDRLLWLSLTLLWASLENLIKLAPQVNAEAEKLSESEARSLSRIIRETVSQMGRKADRQKVVRVNLVPFSERVAEFVAMMFADRVSVLEVPQEMRTATRLNAVIDDAETLARFEQGPASKDLNDVLDWGRAVLRADMASRVEVELQRFMPRRTNEFAATVLSSPEEFPYSWVREAKQAAQGRYRPATLAAVSAEQEWSFA